MIVAVNFNDFTIIFFVSLLSLIGMFFLTHWLIKIRRNRTFILSVWLLFITTIMVGGMNLINSVQKERAYWIRYFSEVAQAFTGTLETLGHQKMEFSFSTWSLPVKVGEQNDWSVINEQYPKLSVRKLMPPTGFGAEKTGGGRTKLQWNPVPEANSYELQQTAKPDDPTQWETIFRGDKTSFVEPPTPGGQTLFYRVRSLWVTPEDDPTYLALCQAIRDAAQSATLAKSFYTMRDYDENNVMMIIAPEIDVNGDGIIDPDKERASPIGETYPKAQAPSAKQFFDEKVRGTATSAVETVTIHDDWGSWVTAYGALFRSDGTLDGVIGADFPASVWENNIFSAQLRPAIFLLFVLALFFGGAVLIARLQCSQEEQQRTTDKLRTTIEELTVAKQAADVASRAKGHFLANMSHEIRTPMNAVLGFADILGRRLVACSPPDQLEENCRTINLIEQSGSDLLTIINDILDFSKVDADQIELEWVPTPLRQILDDVQQLMQNRLEEKPNLVLTLDIDPVVPSQIVSDPTRLRQVLVNLIGNAIKFTARGEVIVQCKLVSFENTPESRQQIVREFGKGINLSLFDNEQEIKLVQFIVQDEGIGMNTTQISRLFQPFTQADTSLTRRYGGTGLGLSISKRLAELLGGDIIVRSEEGEGSTFTMTLAAKILAETGPSPYSGVFLLANNEKPLEGFHFLLVEDGKVNQIVISTQLKEAGASVRIAENGKIAVDLIESEPEGTFDLILMDMQMPVMDGYEATRYLRSKGFDRPIIAVTAHALTGDCEKTLEVGCNAYVSKPIDRNKLIDMILRLDTSACAIE